MKNIKPLRYQRRAVDHIIKGFSLGYRGCILGDKMGLGKTIVALIIAEELPKKYNLIAVVCPAFLKPKWRREILDKCDDYRNYKFAIYSYNDLTDDQQLSHAMSVNYDLIIFDEVHYLKGYKSDRTIAAFGKEKTDNEPAKDGLHIRGKKLLGLSGTFPPNNIGDAFTWMHASNSPLAERGYDFFCHEFAEHYERGRFGLETVKGFRPNERWNQHFPPTFIGRSIDDPEIKADVPKGIPIDFVVDVTKAIEKAEIKLFGQIINDPDLMQKAIEAAPSFDALTEFRKMQGLAKVHAVVDYALEAWNQGEKKLIIAAYHHEVADAIYAALTKKKLPVTLITGLNTAAEDRDNILQKENVKDESVVIATIDALREGVDAIGFSMTLFAEMDWRAWAIEQFEGRTRRIGQTKVVRWVYFFFARGVDKMMRAKIKEKTELANKVRATQCIN